jgi:hypothetical protein
VTPLDIIGFVLVLAVIAVVFYVVATWLFDLFAQGRER